MSIYTKFLTPSGTAAGIASSYSLNGFSDWYLPSQDELNLMYAQKTIVGGFANTFYWSSTEYNSSLAWIRNYVTGTDNIPKKDNNSVGVRAVRAF